LLAATLLHTQHQFLFSMAYFSFNVHRLPGQRNCNRCTINWSQQSLRVHQVPLWNPSNSPDPQRLHGKKESAQSAALGAPEIPTANRYPHPARDRCPNPHPRAYLRFTNLLFTIGFHPAIEEFPLYSAIEARN
jgi:hypothetical protein